MLFCTSFRVELSLGTVKVILLAYEFKRDVAPMKTCVQSVISIGPSVWSLPTLTRSRKRSFVSLFLSNYCTMLLVASLAHINI